MWRSGTSSSSKVALFGGAALAVAVTVSARVFVTLDEALRLAFPDATVETRTVFLTPEQLARARELAREEIPSALVTQYVARRDGRVVGTAYTDTHVVRTLPETVLIVLDPSGAVRRIEVLSFSEPEEYLPRAPWYAQFAGKTLTPELSLSGAIRPVTGATLTARATTAAARRVLALHRVLSEAPAK